MVQITEAATRQDLTAIQHLTKTASELQDLKEQLAAIQQRITSLTGEAADFSVPSANQPTNGARRQLPIEVTDGMIRQNLLTSAPQVKSGKVKVGEEFIIESLPSGERFQTVLLEQGRRLRARSEIRSFYSAAKVNGGDFVLLTEVAPGRWTLKKAPTGEYGVSHLLRDLV